MDITALLLAATLLAGSAEPADTAGRAGSPTLPNPAATSLHADSAFAADRSLPGYGALPSYGTLPTYGARAYEARKTAVAEDRSSNTASTELALASGMTLWEPAKSFDQAVIRAQSPGGSPYYDELPAPGAGGVPQYPYTPGPYPPGTPSPGSPPISGPVYTPDPYNPGTPYPSSPYPDSPYSGGSPPVYSPTPYPTGNYDPFLGPPPGSQPQGFQTPGVNGPEPYRFGWSPAFEVGYIFPASASGPRGAVDVFELDSELRYSAPSRGHNIFSIAPQFGMRAFDGPSTPFGVSGLPSDVYRFGLDLEYVFASPGSPLSAKIGFNPSINSDLEESLTSKAINWDGRAAVFYQASPRLTVVLGAMYYDRVDDFILPYAGFIYLPNDRLALKLIFPEPEISYFAGYVGGKPMWVYARGEFNVEAYEVAAPAGFRNQLQIRDYRVLFGARKDQGWGKTFLEAGFVINREVEYANSLSGFDIGDSALIRGGLEF